MSRAAITAMKKIFLFIFLLASCSPANPLSTQKQVITAYAASAAMPWLTELYACAQTANVAINVSADAPDIFLRLGEPDVLTSPVYQIGKDEILIVTHQDGAIQNLTLEESQKLFSGRGDSSIQVWVYDSGTDLQILFDQLVMKGRSVSSSAKVAVSPEKMAEAINSEVSAIGILTRRSINASPALREVYSAGMVPVLAITKTEATGIVEDLLACVAG